MSLTGLLRHPHGPVAAFFAERLGHLDGVRAAWRAAGPVTLRSPAPPAWASLVGTALDYRIRFAFASPDPGRLVAAAGAHLLAAGGVRGRRSSAAGGAGPYGALSSALVALAAGRSRIPIGDRRDRELAGFCAALALFEQVYRSRRRTAGPLAALGGGAGLDELLELVPSPVVDDVVTLADAFGATQQSLLARPAVCNPVFSASVAVGGADGDLVVDDLLVDIKSSASMSLERVDVWQLVGYALLDADGHFGIRRVGFYVARRPALIVWDLDKLVCELAGESVTVVELRAELLAVLAESRRA